MEFDAAHIEDGIGNNGTHIVDNIVASLQTQVSICLTFNLVHMRNIYCFG